MLALSVLAFLVAEATTNALVLDQPRSPARVLHWSIWRRTHQGRARHIHYQRRRAS
ncbi:hypothetical protein ACFW6N_32300 [Streptomyces cyaneofuscatus]|uniref:hypothetical protein n=1 Tax=Streptomyces cyaneofuscatus TaxID=66883 RepID=UPI0036BEC9E3